MDELASSLDAATLMAGLDSAELNRMHDHIGQWYPSEACGLLFESADGVGIVELCENLADKYHALDAEMYPRTGADAFILNPMLIVKGETRGDRLVGIWHSHVRVGAYFSEEDIDQALTNEEPTAPCYPGVQHVVFDAQDDGVRGYKVFAWKAGRQFAEVSP